MVITQVAKSVPFNNSINGFTATNTQEAIEEAKLNINSLTLKAIPVSADLLIIEDSADSFNQKKIEVSNLLNDFKLKVSSNDTTADYLENKIVVSDGSNSANILEVSTLNDGLDEDLQFQIDETKINHDNLLNYSATEHFTEVSISHLNIQDIGTNSHVDIDSHIANTSNPHSVTKTQVGLDNVTNDEQLKRSAGDWSTFSIKASPIGADYVLIEDSADSFNKKYATITSLGIANTDELLKVSSNDTTAGYLEDKIVVSSGSNATDILELSTLNDGLDEDLQIQIDESKIDHDNLLNTHNLTTDIDHDTLTNTHNLTTDIDHDTLTNTHNLTTDIDHTTITNIGTNSHAQIDTHIASTSNPHSVTKTQVNLGNVTNDAQLKRSGNDWGSFGTATPVSGDYLLFEDASDSYNKKYATLSSFPFATDEKVKVSANDTTEGYLENKIVVSEGSNSTNILEVSTLNDGLDEDLQIQIDESKIVHQNLNGAGTNTHAQIDTHISNANIHFTEASIDHTAILNIGTNSHAQIDSHIADTSNPHSVTKTQVSLGNVTNDAQLKRSGNDWNGFGNKATPINNDLVLIEDSADSLNKKYITISQLPDEANTASNVGTSGVGIFKQKTGVDLEFKKLKAGSTIVSIVDDVANSVVELDINSTQIDHTDLQNKGTNTHAQIDTHIADSTLHYVQAAIDHTAILNIGTNSHAQIDSHIANTSNPHSVTKTQVSLGNVTNDAQLKRSGNDFTTFSENLSPASDDYLLIEDTSDSYNKKKIKIGNLPGSTINDEKVKITASDTTTDFLFEKLLVSDGSNSANILEISVLNPGADEDIQIQIDETKIDHTAILNIGTNSHADIDTHIADSTIHFTESSIDHTAIANIGTNSHADIDSHIANNSNPHNVLATQITDFDTEVSNNTDVAANTVHRTSNGTDHTYIDQDVTTTAFPTFTGIQFTPGTAPSYAEGKLFYDSADKCLSYYNEEADIQLCLGRESFIRVKNESGSNILNGSVVYINSATSGLPLIELADSKYFNKSRVIGVVTHDIENNTIGYVTKFGDVNNLNTSGFNLGDIVYLDPSNIGGLTNTRPTNGDFPCTIGIITLVNASTGKLFVDINCEDYTAETHLDTGWPDSNDNSGVDVSWDDGTKTLTLTPSGVASDFRYYELGIKYIKTSDSIVLPDTEGLYIIYYNADTLSYVLNPTDSQISSIIRNNTTVAYVYWNTNNNVAEYVGDERHSKMMPSITHNYLHYTQGAKYNTGLALTDILTDENGDIDSHAQFGVESGSYYDEDIFHSISTVTSTTGLKIYYLTGTEASPTLRSTTNSGFSVTTAGTGRMAFNELTGGNWQLTEVNNNDFVMCHVFANNGFNQDEKIIAFVGQEQYNTLGNARDGALTEINNIIITGIVGYELLPIASIIFQTNNGYANAVKGRIRKTATGEDYVDWRNVGVIASGGTSGGTVTPIFPDNQFIIHDDTDITKQLQFECSGITTATTKTLTIPDSSGTIALLSDLYTLKVSSNDTTADYLENKIVISEGLNSTDILELSTLNDGLDEDLQIQIDETKIDHDNLLNFDASEHFTETSISHLVIQDIGTNSHAQIDTHIASTSNPHSVTKTQVSLGNVTNDAQVKKISSSTDNAIIRWDGTTGDLPQDSLATISDTGTLNIPTGQEYQINGSQHTHNEIDIIDLDHTDADAIHDNVAGEINALTEIIAGNEQITDILIMEDANDSFNKKKISVQALMRVVVSDNDSQGSWLSTKLIGTTNRITTTEVNDGAFENLQLDVGSDIVDLTTADQFDSMVELLALNPNDKLIVEDSNNGSVKKYVQADEVMRCLVSSNDTSGGYLNGKIVGTSNRITLTEENDGGSEDLKIDVGSEVITTTDSAQISGLTEKVSPVSGDWLIIEDSAASNVKKKVQVGSIGGGVSGVSENLPQFIISGNGYAINTGLKKGYLVVPFACTLTGYTIYPDVSTSTVIDVWKTTYADYDGGATHPVNGDSITASAPITITTALKAQDNTLTGWTTSLSKDDILAFNVDSNDNATVLTIVFHTTRS